MTRHVTIADCLPAVAFGEDGRIDDWRLKRTPATRRLQFTEIWTSCSLLAKATRRPVALPKLGRNKSASRIDFARSALGVRVRPRTAVGPTPAPPVAHAFAQTASTLQHFNGSPGRAD